jgi:hypothetical protein
MDPNIRALGPRLLRHQLRENGQITAFAVDDLNRRKLCAGHRDRHHMSARVAGFKLQACPGLLMVVIVDPSRMVLVSCKSVVVFGMVVIEVGVNMQRGSVTGAPHQRQADRDRGHSLHRRECMVTP